MIKLSALKSIPVVCESQRVGILLRPCIDQAQKRVCALLVAGGMAGRHMVLPHDVISLGGSFMLVARVRRYCHALDRKACAFARDSSGLLVGRVSDYAVEEATLRILAVEITTAYAFLPYCKRFWTETFAPCSHQPSDLIIPAGLGLNQEEEKEGSFPCASPQ